ncbi:MAG: hypothetical protein KDC44_13980 [Phaeodactylibacter sp.]|nr:hypothetical protein [Phaeodactylibacter sp.]
MFQKDLIGLILAGFLFLLGACTPKTADVVEEPKPATDPKVDENLSPCPKFSDAISPDDAETNYVLYRDFLRSGDYTQAFELWKKVYKVSPAADGQRNTVFSDGIYFYERLVHGAESDAERNEYIDFIFQLYDEIDNCYPEGGYIDGRKAFDLFYKYPERAKKEEIYALFKKSIDTDGAKTHYFVLNPFTSLLVDLFFENKIDQQEALKYQDIVRNVLEKGLSTCKGQDCENWEIINGYVPVRLEAFETVKGFYDCDYYKEHYLPVFEENPTDCDVIRTAYSRMVFGGCPDMDEAVQKIKKAGNDNCVEEKAVSKAYDALREARYNDAIDLFEQAISEETDSGKKAKYTLTIAKIYHAHLRNFSKARQYARTAASQRGGWGEPYLLIGRLYASSGPLCGPGRGWDSQIVVWPAIDQWTKAKQVDPSVAAEANKWINRYTQYMPNREDIFQRSLKEGDSFYVGCWIQETTVIRAAPY